MSEKNGLTITCRRKDGSIIPTNEKGEFDPPVIMPLEIHMDLIKILNPGKRIVFRKDGEIIGIR